MPRDLNSLRRMAVSTLALSACDGGSALRWLGELVRRLPCFWLDLGRDLERIPDRTVEVLERGMSAHPAV